MHLPRLPGPDTLNRRFGRRAGDGATPGYAAAFVAQVAGLSLPQDAPAHSYPEEPPLLPRGRLMDARA
jgi:hypothetical protein